MNIDYPLSIDDRSFEFGGTKTIEEASRDGVGVILKGNGSNDSRNIYINNQPYNILVQKYGEEAEISGLSVANYVLDYDLNNPNTIPVLDVKYANMINDSIQDSGLLADRTPCDDDNPDTIQDYYEDGICVGHYSYSCEDGEGVTKDELITLINDDEDVTAVCTSNITDMSSLFSGNLDFNQDISAWDVSNVTTMNHMFASLSSFNNSIENWDTSSVENMSYMFYDARAMNSDITTWDTSNVNNMSYMFRSADVFNQDISGWNIPLIDEKPTDFDYATLDDWTDSMKPVW